VVRTYSFNYHQCLYTIYLIKLANDSSEASQAKKEKISLNSLAKRLENSLNGLESDQKSNSSLDPGVKIAYRLTKTGSKRKIYMKRQHCKFHTDMEKAKSAKDGESFDGSQASPRSSVSFILFYPNFKLLWHHKLKISFLQK